MSYCKSAVGAVVIAITLIMLSGGCSLVGLSGEGLPKFKETATFIAIDKTNPSDCTFPGGRGPDEMVLYAPEFGDRTGTNQWGSEAVVENGIVVTVGQNNSLIPSNGFVLSGHGKANYWITEHLLPGTEIEIVGQQAIALTTAKSLIYQTRARLKLVKETLEKAHATAAAYPAADAQERYAASEVDLEMAVAQLERGRTQRAGRLAMRARQKALEAFALTKPSRSCEGRGVWYRLTEKNPRQLKKTIARLQRNGFNLIFPETIYWGYSIYPPPNSGFAPQGDSRAVSFFQQNPAFRRWDPLKTLIEVAHENGIQVHVWVHVFFIGFKDSPFIESHPLWLARNKQGEWASTREEGYFYLCMSNEEVRTFLLENFKALVMKYDIDGFQLDYIRYPVSEPFEEGYCYCHSCRGKFFDQYGHDPVDLSPTETPEIWKKWNAFREEQISSFVHTVSMTLRSMKPDLKISADVFSELADARRSKFQNWAEWAQNQWVDFLCPMAYSTDVGAVRNNVARMREIVPPALPIFVGLAPYLGLSGDALLDQIEATQQEGADGVVLFSLSQISDDMMHLLALGPFRMPAAVPE